MVPTRSYEDGDMMDMVGARMLIKVSMIPGETRQRSVGGAWKRLAGRRILLDPEKESAN